MKRPEEVKREFVGQWLRKGAGDLKIARYLLGGSPDLSYGAAFHAQVVRNLPIEIGGQCKQLIRSLRGHTSPVGLATVDEDGIA